MRLSAVFLVCAVACGRPGAPETASTDSGARPAPPAAAAPATKPDASSAPVAVTADAPTPPTTSARSGPLKWSNVYDLFPGTLSKRGAALVLTLEHPVDIVNDPLMKFAPKHTELHGVREVDVENGVDKETGAKIVVDEALVGRRIWLVGEFKPKDTDPTRVKVTAMEIIDPSKPALRFGDTETLTGKLVQQSFASPQGGTEKQYVLVLDEPIDVTPGPNDSNGKSASGVKRVMLACVGECQPWVNKRVSAKGSLFPPHTGHHHTPVLLLASEMTKPNP